MKTFTVSFFGHRRMPASGQVYTRLEALVAAMLLEKEYVEFLVGRDGDFDWMVAAAVRRQKRLVRADNSALIWVLPYSTAQLRDHRGAFLAYYDEIEICGGTGHPKGAFQMRNRQMVDRSDLVIFYVSRNSGGAYQTMRYAQRRQKRWVNLYGMDCEETE